MTKIVPDRAKSLKKGAELCRPVRPRFVGLQANRGGAGAFGHTLDTPSRNWMTTFSPCSERHGRAVESDQQPGLSRRNIQFEGIIPFVLGQAEEGTKARRNGRSSSHGGLPECEGTRD
ncbi:MAG: hypothetical protein IPP33_18915 [Flavobacteriales bacterium]|nr:hypothetical protein [Flavobacteriales bacterium]